jgi:hypothetical protein
LLGVYRVSKEENRTNKMIVMGAEHVITFPNLFTYYEQNMAKSINFFDYYNNVYQRWSEKWWIMTVVKRGSQKWLKETTTISE